MQIKAAERLIVALDAPPYNPQEPDRLIETADALRLVEELGEDVHFYKIGWPLYMAAQSEGVPILRAFRERKKKIFLDLKFGDIPETVKLLVAVAASESVDFLTLNAPLNSIQAGVEAKGGSPLKILVVTLLTSQGKGDLEQMGINMSVEEFVLARAQQARQIGHADGVIASGQEAAAIREKMGKDFLIVTPGIRPAGEGHHDHKRTVTPAEAIRAGADYLVVGRPVVQAPHPREATLRILEQMQNAFDSLRV
ncbi:MAG: orotidine-5'-phosphate decarboxylase [Acidobacteria bacterium]|nr:orotidine-5'-phosphate decarboxylase [Acidobacteriota bacterium]